MQKENNMKWYIPIIISVILSSCSAQWHLKRAVKKDPAILEKDTIVAVDTIVTPPVALTDTVVLKETDTIVVEKERLKVKISRSFDTIRVDATCESEPNVIMLDETGLVTNVSFHLNSLCINLPLSSAEFNPI